MPIGIWKSQQFFFEFLWIHFSSNQTSRIVLPSLFYDCYLVFIFTEIVKSLQAFKCKFTQWELWFKLVLPAVSMLLVNPKQFILFEHGGRQVYSRVSRPRGAAVHEGSLPLPCRHGIPLVDDPVNILGHVDSVGLALRSPDEGMF